MVGVRFPPASQRGQTRCTQSALPDRRKDCEFAGQTMRRREVQAGRRELASSLSPAARVYDTGLATLGCAEPTCLRCRLMLGHSSAAHANLHLNARPEPVDDRYQAID